MTDKRDYSFNKEDDDLLDNNKKSKKETSKNSSDRTNEFLIGHNGRCFDVRSQQQRNQSSLILSASEGFIKILLDNNRHSYNYILIYYWIP